MPKHKSSAKPTRIATVLKGMHRAITKPEVKPATAQDVLERLTAFVVKTGKSPSTIASEYTAAAKDGESVTWITITRWLKGTSGIRNQARVDSLHKYLKDRGF